MNDALIFSNCDTNDVASFGIQLPITTRPPGFVTRTISLATSSGLGANVAPDTDRVKSNESSPISSVATWKSPVLLIHGDDDRTVNFHQTVDLRRRLLDKGVKVEELVLPDDVHDALLWQNWKTSIAAMAQFFERTLQAKPARSSLRE